MTLNGTANTGGDSQITISATLNISVNITSPIAGMNYTTLNLTLSGSTGVAGNITFSINGGTNITVCNNCSTFSVNLLNYSRFGANNVTIYFENASVRATATVSFNVVCLKDYDLLVYIARCMRGEFDEQELLQAIDAWAKYHWE
jgi:hypothetical protein